jgi:hypothetical protein
LGWASGAAGGAGWLQGSVGVVVFDDYLSAVDRHHCERAHRARVASNDVLPLGPCRAADNVVYLPAGKLIGGWDRIRILFLVEVLDVEGAAGSGIEAVRPSRVVVVESAVDSVEVSASQQAPRRSARARLDFGS